MAQIFLAALSMFVVVAFCRGAPHIPGGGLNTVVENSATNNLIRSVISNMMSSRTAGNNREVTANEIRSLINEDQGNTPNAEDNRSNSQPVYSQTIRIALPPAVFSGMDQVNPFIRNKRQACQMTPVLSQNLSQLIQILNSTDNTMFIGRSPNQTSDPRIPANQPAECPRVVMASSSEERLRSNCPWNLTKRDLGANAYPRYVEEASCLCERCIGTNPTYTCQPMRANATYFELHSCLDGVALLKKKTTLIVVGCFCASPAPLLTPRTTTPYTLDY